MKKIIDVIATSGAFPASDLVKMADFLKSKGFEARIPANILGEDLLCANNETTRLELLKQALYSTDSDLIWCVRGGYGATPLLPGLKDLAPPQLKKNLIGFSDITALHLFLTQQWGWQTTHGAALRQLAERNINTESLLLNEALLSGGIEVDQSLTPLNTAAQNVHISGVLTGGNLKLIEASLGTFWQINAQDKILMLEEVSEFDYRVARSLVHLEQAGVLKQIKALVLGCFNYDNHPEQEVKIQKYLDEFAKMQSFPVFRALFFGHTQINNPWKYAPAQIEGLRLIQSI